MKFVIGSGQSNAMGGGGSEGGNQTINNRVFAWDHSINDWVVATPGNLPFYPTEPGQQPRNNIIWNACKDLQVATGEDVYMVLSGEGSTSITKWNPVDGEQWELLDGRVKDALASPEMVAAGKTVADYFLWFQGENTYANLNYGERFLEMRNAAITEGWLEEDTRVIAGEIIADNRSKQDLLNLIGSGDNEWLHMAVNTDIPTSGLHFTGSGSVTFGHRFFDAMFETNNRPSIMMGCDEFIFGTSADDSFVAFNRTMIRGNDGNDWLRANGDDNVVYGGKNADIIRIEGDDNFLHGAGGNDVFNFYGGYDNAIRGGDGYDVVKVYANLRNTDMVNIEEMIYM